MNTRLLDNFGSTAAARAAGLLQPLDRHLVLAVLLVAMGYYAGVKIGFALTFQPHPISVLWPPNAILLGALVCTAKIKFEAAPQAALTEFQNWDNAGTSTPGIRRDCSNFSSVSSFMKRRSPSSTRPRSRPRSATSSSVAATSLRAVT